MEGPDVIDRKSVWLKPLVLLLSGLTARKGAASLADQMVVSAANFATGVIIGRACTQEEFGLYMLGLSIVLFATNFQSSLISSPYTVYSPRLTERERHIYTGSTLIHQLGISIFSTTMLAAAAFTLPLRTDAQGLAPVLFALAFAISFILLREFVRRLCFARLSFRNAFILDTVVTVLQIGGLLWLAHLRLLSARIAFGTIGLACAVAVTGWLITSHRSFRPRFGSALPDFKLNWSFGKWIFLSGLIWTLSSSLYPWILTIYHGTASTGVWAACFGAVAIGNPLLFGMLNFLGPRLAHSYAESPITVFRNFVYKAVSVFCLMTVPLCIIFLFFGGSLVVLIYGHDYAGNDIVVAVLGLSLFLGAVRASFSRALFAMGFANFDFAANSLSFIVLITLGIPLVRAFGPLGIAVALLGSNAIVSASKFVAFNFLIRNKMKDSKNFINENILLK